MTETPETPGIATASLVLGILGLFCLGPFGAIPAVICGHKANSRIKNSEGRLQGGGLALAGMILGYVSIGLMVILIPIYAAIIIPAVSKAKEAAEEVICMSNMQQMTIEPGTAQTLACPSEGTYTLSSPPGKPECTFHGPLVEYRP